MSLEIYKKLRTRKMKHAYNALRIIARWAEEFHWGFTVWGTRTCPILLTSQIQHSTTGLRLLGRVQILKIKYSTVNVKVFFFPGLLFSLCAPQYKGNRRTQAHGIPRRSRTFEKMFNLTQEWHSLLDNPLVQKPSSPKVHKLPIRDYRGTLWLTLPINIIFLMKNKVKQC